jgi:hypothetical protein
MNSSQNNLRLFPRYFNKIGLGIILGIIVFMLLSFFEIFFIDKEVAKTITKTLFLISLLIFSITRSKIEDELTVAIRLKAFAASFIFGVMIVIVDPFVNLVFEGVFLLEKGAVELLISMLLFYFFMVFLMKKNR